MKFEPPFLNFEVRSVWIFLVLILATARVELFAQEEGGQPKIVSAIVENGDTVPVVWLHSIYVNEARNFRNKRQRRRYNHLKYHVKKVYPYAKLAGNLFQQYEDSLAMCATHRERKRFYKKIELELRDRYEDELKNLSITQGRILIKLVDREIGSSSYEILSELRNVFTAFFWQSIAKIFGNDLKARYDPLGEDKEIENIVVLIEQGFIK